MKRIIYALLTAAIMVGLFTPTANAAGSDGQRRTPGCVTKWEYRHLHRNMTPDQVARYVGTRGYFLGTEDNSYYEGDWVEDGYWDYEYDDLTGEYTDVWVDTSYWDEYANYVSVLDAYRTYKKCKSFDRGRGRVALNFDNYSSRYAGWRLFAKVNFRRWPYAVGRSAEAEQSMPHKVYPTAPARPAKPEPHPTTPAPHAKG